MTSSDVPMRRLALPAVALLLLVTGLGLAPSRAWAGDDRPAVERLTPVELEHVRRNVPDWDDLPEERRDRIAKNVLRLRDLPPEDRRRLKERMERFRKEDASLRERLPDRLARLQGPSRERFRVQALVATAVGRDLLRSLPDDVRRVLVAAAPAVRGGGPGPGPRLLGPALLGFAFSRAVLEREAEAVARSGAALRHVPSAEAAARFRALAAKVEVASAEDRPRELRALAAFVVEDRARAAVVPARAEPAGGAARNAVRPNDGALVGALRSAFPDAWRATTEDLVERARRSPEDLRRLLSRHAPKPERRGRARNDAFLLVRLLEQAGPWLASNPEARGHADRLLEAVLVQGLGVPPARVEALPSWDRPGERVRALKRLLLARELRDR